MASARKSKKSNISGEELMDHYRSMLLIRRFEEKAGQLYGMGLIGGFCTFTSARKRSSSDWRPAPRKATSA